MSRAAISYSVYGCCLFVNVPLGLLGVFVGVHGWSTATLVWLTAANGVLGFAGLVSEYRLSRRLQRVR